MCLNRTGYCHNLPIQVNKLSLALKDGHVRILP